MESLLKSIFIILLPTAAFLAVLFSGWNLWQSGFSFRDPGVLISGMSIVLFFAFLFLFKRPRTDRNLRAYTAPLVLGGIMGIYGCYTEPSAMPHRIILGLLIAGWAAYLFWYSSFGERKSALLKTGNQLIEFSLEDTNGQLVSSTKFLGKPSIFMFYRGNWCPLCTAQVKEIAGQYKALEERGANMVLISPQPHRSTEKLARKYDVGFHFLVDVKNKAAKKLGIFAKFGTPMGFQVLGFDSDTVLPTVIITDKNGKIIFLDQTDNYRIRPEPATFLKALDQL